MQLSARYTPKHLLIVNGGGAAEGLLTTTWYNNLTFPFGNTYVMPIRPTPVAALNGRYISNIYKLDLEKLVTLYHVRVLEAFRANDEIQRQILAPGVNRQPTWRALEHASDSHPRLTVATQWMRDRLSLETISYADHYGVDRSLPKTVVLHNQAQHLAQRLSGLGVEATAAEVLNSACNHVLHPLAQDATLNRVFHNLVDLNI